MKKGINKNKVTAMLIVSSVFGGVILGSEINSTIQSNRQKAYANEIEYGDDIAVGYNEVENAMFPMYGNVSLHQTAFESGPGTSHSTSNAMDISSDDPFFRAPFSGKIVNYNPDSGYCNEFIYQSHKKVRWADDRLDTMSIYILHSQDDAEISNLLYNNKLQGDALVTQGKASGRGMIDEEYGVHLDVQVACGAKDYFADNAAGNGEVLGYNAFFVGPETTLYTDSDRGLQVPKELDSYEGLWIENGAFRYTKSKTSILKITCPKSLAFEDEYSLWDVLVGDELHNQATKLSTIENVINNFASLEYDGLSEYEKKVYDSCSTEWVDSIPDEINEIVSNVVNETEEMFDYSIIDEDTELTSSAVNQAEEVIDDGNAYEISVDAHTYESPLIIDSTNEVEESEKSYLFIGDATNDGIIDGRDATAVLSLAAKLSTGLSLTEEEILINDTDHDNNISANDARLILKYYTHSSIESDDNLTFEEYTNQLIR